MISAASRTELEQLVADDTPYGDLTTCALGIDAIPGQMEFCARGSMIVAETESAAGILEILRQRPLLSVELLVDEQLQPDDAAGIAKRIRVPGERTFLHAIEHEAVLVGFVGGHGVRIIDDAD